MVTRGVTATPGAVATRGATGTPGETTPRRTALAAARPRSRSRAIQMRRRVHNMIRVFVAWATLFAIGAAQASAPVPAARPIYFEHLTMRDGLSQSTVMSVLQDSQGYLWLATESGLDRYDGYSIRAYRRDRGNQPRLPRDFILASAEEGARRRG